MHLLKTFFHRMAHPIEGAVYIHDDPTVLIAKFHGKIRFGSSGNAQAEYMQDLLFAAISEHSPRALVIDLRDVSYKFGNSVWNMWSALDCLESISVVIVTSESSDELEPYINRMTSLPVTRSLEEALIRIGGGPD